MPMKYVKFEDLKPIEKLPTPLLHKSGNILVEEGSSLSQPIIDYMGTLDIKGFFFLDENESYSIVRRELTHFSVDLDSLKAGEKLIRAIYDPKGQLLLDEGASTPKNFSSSLRKRGIDSIFIRKSPEEMELDVAKEFKRNYEKIAKQSTASEEPKAFEEKAVEEIKEIKVVEADVDDFDVGKLEKKLNTAKSMEVVAEGESFSNQVRDTRKIGTSTKEEKKAFTDTINDCVENLKDAFSRIIKSPREFNIAVLDEIVCKILAGTIHHRDLLNICGTAETNDLYMIKHPLAVSVISVNIGTSMGFGPAQIKSLAYGALLADIGLFKIPAEILNKKGKLTPREYAVIKRHPAIGLDILQKVRGLPAEVPYIVYQSHERPNGSGYPCGKKDIVIHTFARIVSVADSYLALCAERPYREGKIFYEAMEQIIFMAGKKMLNANVIRSFLSCVSLFPVGSFVSLSDGHIARVVAANPEDYMRPVVSKIWTREKQALSNIEKIDLLEKKEISVTQALTEDSVPLNGDYLIGF